MALTAAPPPDYLVEREQKSGRVTDRITQSFRQWLLSLTTLIQASARVLTVVRLTGQVASIGSTGLTLPTLAAGTYRLTFYARITTAASVSSSLTVTFGWTDSTIALSASAAAITGNTTDYFDGALFNATTAVIVSGSTGAIEPPGSGTLAPLRLLLGPTPGRGPIHFALSGARATGALVRLWTPTGALARVWRIPEGVAGAAWSWDGRSSGGEVAPSGVYFVTVDSGGERVKQRLVYLR